MVLMLTDGETRDTSADSGYHDTESIDVPTHRRCRAPREHFIQVAETRHRVPVLAQVKDDHAASRICQEVEQGRMPGIGTDLHDTGRELPHDEMIRLFIHELAHLVMYVVVFGEAIPLHRFARLQANVLQSPEDVAVVLKHCPVRRQRHMEFEIEHMVFYISFDRGVITDVDRQ